MPLKKYFIDEICSLDISSEEKLRRSDEIQKLSISDLSLLFYKKEMYKVYKEYPVDIETFIHDPYYLGSIYADNIYPIWDSLLKEIYPAPLLTRYSEVILSAALRSGKTTSAAISVLYEIHKLMCMIDPASFYLGKSTARLVIALISKDISTLQITLGQDVYKGLSNSPYFIDRVGDKLAYGNLCKQGISVTNNILLIGGSNVGTVTGADIYTAVVDEANIQTTNIAEGNLVKVKMEMYDHILDRKQATLSKAPVMSGIVWMMSSPTEEDDVIGERIDIVRKNKVKDVKILDNKSRWECRDEMTKKTFRFYLGSDTKDPEILTVDSDMSRYEKDRILDVPHTDEYYNAFKDNPIAAIRDIAGRRTTSDLALFNSVSIFPKIFSRDNDIFTKDVLTINFGEDAKLLDISDYLYNKNYFSNCKNKNCYRYIHLDIASKKDRFGLASVYSDIIEFTSKEGLKTRKRMYFVDFCIGIECAKGCVVDITKVLKYIYNLKKLKYPLKLVTTDSYQGEVSRLILKQNNVDAEYLSVERDKAPFYNLKNIILEESLIGYKNPLLIKELGGLRDFKGKVDKSKGNTDDLAGALAGALFSCARDENFKSNTETINSLIEDQNFDIFSSSLEEDIIMKMSIKDKFKVEDENYSEIEDVFGINK